MTHNQKDILLGAFKTTSANEQTFNFVENNKDSLLITIGDSWTVGGSFGFLIEPNAKGVNDPRLRMFQRDNVFGNTLRQYLDADWYNISASAISNAWMATQFEEFAKICDQLTYKKIYVVITFTEVGREWQMIIDPAIVSFAQTLNELVFKRSAQIEDIILSAMRDDIELIVGRNYVDDSYPNLSKFMLEDSWLDVLAKADNKNLFDDKCYMVGGLAFDPLRQLAPRLTNISREDFMAMMSEYADSAHKRIDLLTHSKYNIHKIGYQHPTPEGHKLWADYVFSYIRKRGRVDDGICLLSRHRGNSIVSSNLTASAKGL